MASTCTKNFPRGDIVLSLVVPVPSEDRSIQQTLSLEFNCTDTNLLEFTVPTLKVWDIVVLHPSCDLNNDGTVDILDIAIVAKAFNTEPGDPNWNAIADLDKSGVIDILDIAKVAKDFGKTV